MLKNSEAIFEKNIILYWESINCQKWSLIRVNTYILAGPYSYATKCLKRLNETSTIGDSDKGSAYWRSRLMLYCVSLAYLNPIPKSLDKSTASVTKYC